LKYCLSVLHSLALGSGLACNSSAAEPWADERLPVTNRLELWFDASRQNAGRGAFQLAPITAWNPVDYLLDGSGHARHLAQLRSDARPKFRQEFTGAYLSFDGKDDALAGSQLGAAFTNLTVFLVAAPRSNAGGFRAFFGLSQAGRNDYLTGVNLDLGPNASEGLSLFNAEGAGFSGAAALFRGASFPFRTWHVFALTCQPGPAGVRLFVDGQPHGTRERKDSLVRLDAFVLGARHYSNTSEPPFTQGFLEGNVAEFLLYSRALPEAERTRVEKYLSAKYGQLLALPPGAAGEGAKLLVTVTNPPPVQMLVPGFTVRELPIKLPNVNNVKYRADGKLVAVGYNGHVWVLRDTNGDGLEDQAEPFWTNDTVHAPIGLALTPPGDARGQGVFLPAKGKVVLLVDTNGDDRADQEIVAAIWTEKSDQQGVDALGVAVDRDGSLYFGLGAASYSGAYLVDKATGESRYSLKSERGAILKVAPDFSRREIVCTGIRFSVGMALNRQGDLFVTDQEGATWLPNGNPFDELLHIQPGRHYGFPPRHPRHLPKVIDEPSVFDYAPQHQSTCGLNFNDPVNGGPTFGPSWWAGDAIVCGYSRGKIWRTKLVKTAAGYVAQNQLIACLQALTVDACVSPQGDLVVSTHSGQPDWGSGPTGKGKLYKISFASRARPQPVLVWSASPTEIRIAFDKPLDPVALKDVAKRARLEQGKYVFAGDRFETIRPGYQVVYDQMATPRYDVPVLSASLSADRRTLALTTRPRAAAMNCAVAIGLPLDGSAASTVGSLPEHGFLPQHPDIDLLTDLTGVEAEWRSADAQETWSGWLPHADLAVAREFTQGSAEHEQFWPLLRRPGRLTLRGQLDLWQMLQPAIQPGSKLDYERPPEMVEVTFKASAPLELQWPGGKATPSDPRQITVSQKPPENAWLPFTLSLPTSEAEPSLEVTWSTKEDPRPRAFPLRRFLLRWAKPGSQPSDSGADRQIPELAGGSWLQGKRLFFGDSVACHKCHRVHGQGGKVGPDLSNLVFRDYASVLKDIREPSAAINPDHVAYNVELTDGDALSGVLLADARDRFTLADGSGLPIELLKGRVRSIQPSLTSFMPEGLAQALSPEQLRDLMTFLLTEPLQPGPLEIPGAPPPRRMAEVDAVLTAVPALTGGNPAPSQKPPEGGSPNPLRIVLCAGPKDHGPGEHDYPLWQKRWAKLLALADGVNVSTAQVWPSTEQLAAADVIVFYSNNPGWNARRASELDAFLARGGGLVDLHWAVEGHKHVDELAERIGLAWRDGHSKFRHGPLDLELHPHPLASGLDRLHFIDESYWQLVGDPQRIDLLASAVEEGASRPLLWTRTQGRGRVFVSIPGHYTWTFDDPLFRVLILRGICWVAGQPMDRLAELATLGARLAE
jgi:putative heme-binding domain-containing protein